MVRPSRSTVHLGRHPQRQMKFCYVIAQFDHQFTSEVEDIITSPLQKDPYTKLKTELVNRLSPSRDQHACQLFTLEEVGDHKPSQFLRHLRSLAPDIPDYLLHILWNSRLPANIQTTLASMPKVGLDTVALCTDHITEAVSPSTLACVSPIPDSALMCQFSVGCRERTALKLHKKGSQCKISIKQKNKLHGLSPRANYTDRATAACRQSDCQLVRIKGATWSA
jgi:hypothetical protein